MSYTKKNQLVNLTYMQQYFLKWHMRYATVNPLDPEHLSHWMALSSQELWQRDIDNDG